jgi:hypothetical protein
MSKTVTLPASTDPWVTPSYCSDCHANRHPGCGCPCHRPSGATRDYWTAALKFYATGRTAANLRATADATGQLTAAGLTPVKCWYLSGLDQFHGPFPGAVAA